MKRVIQFLISLGFFPCYFLWRVCRQIAGAPEQLHCVILYYHAVPVEHRQAFARQMDALGKVTCPIRIDSIPPLISGVRYSAVTFDDFFQNVVENALPELKQRKIPAAIFVTTRVLGEHAAWWPDSAPERLQRIGSLEQLVTVSSDLVLIGSHTLTHPKLPDLEETQALWEISESRLVLGELLKREVTTFSFPFGAFNSTSVELCRQAGYERVFTTLPTMAFRNPQEFVTGRVKVDPTDWPLEFRLKILGAYQWLPLAFKLKKRLFYSPMANRLRNFGAVLKSAG